MATQHSCTEFLALQGIRFPNPEPWEIHYAVQEPHRSGSGLSAADRPAPVGGDTAPAAGAYKGNQMV